MADEVIRRQGSATDHQSFTGAAGEITVDNTNWNLRIHDGATAGGFQTAMVTDFGGPTTAEVGKGAIVESGSNSNGSYVRWENGEQACWADITVDWETTNNQSFPYPASFIGNAAISFSADNGTSSAYNDAIRSVAAKHDSADVWQIQLGTTTTTFANPATVFAWGYWK